MAAALESLNGFSFVCVCVLMFLCLSLWVREHADTRWMIGDRTREIKWWWLNHEWQHYTLSLELWEQEGGGQHYPLEIDVGVCASIQMTERDWCWLYCVIGCVCSCCTSISSSSSNERSSNTTTTTTNSSPNTNIINLNIHLLASTTKTTQPK